MDKRIKILIGIPTASPFLHRKFVQSLMSLIYPPNCDVDINVVEGYQLPFARNRIVKHALDTNSDYVFFIDADMVFEPDLLMKLWRYDLPMINALAFRRTSPHYPCIFKWNEKENCYETVTYSKGLLEVDATGMAAHLIKTEVFKAMKQPWYYYRDNLFSSDLTFCENAKKLGYKIIIDTDTKIGHLGDENVITEDFYLNHLSPEAKEQWNQNMKEYIKNNKADFKENSV
jgi:glycosyltransferase involved in cell wall biosynthesis